jgi:hypothetical protein
MGWLFARQGIVTLSAMAGKSALKIVFTGKW